MAAAPRYDRVRGHRWLVGEAAGIAPVLVLAALGLWLVLSHDPRTPEAGLERARAAASATAVSASPQLHPPHLLIVVVSEAGAGNVRALLEAEAQLKGLLGETPRSAEVLTAGSLDHAVNIAEGIRQDQANPAARETLSVAVVP